MFKFHKNVHNSSYWKNNPSSNISEKISNGHKTPNVCSVYTNRASVAPQARILRLFCEY